MTDAENAVAASTDAENVVAASKKRVAGRQISKDTDLDDDTSEPEMESFQRASEEVLATRRIVKIRRQQPTSNASANPFTGICLVSSTNSTENARAQVKPQEPSDKAAIEEPKFSNGEDKEIKSGVLLTNGTCEYNNNSECSTDIQAATGIDKESNSAVKKVSQSSEAAVEVESDKKGVGRKIIETTNNESTEEAGGNDEENPKEAYEDSQREAGEKPVDTVGEEKKGETVKNNLKEAAGSASHFSSFQQLSSSQNAFIGLSGTGFETSSFSFGSLKEGSTFGSCSGSAFGSFSFGGSNNVTSSIPLFGDTTKSGICGVPSLSEVLVETGEENEKSVFNADATLYEYLDESWKERGRGEIKVNTSISGEKARLIMRARGNYRLILNASLYPDMTLANMDKKGITFTCINMAGEGRTSRTTCALKFKDRSIVEEFRVVVTEHKGAKATTLKTPENSAKVSDE